MSGRWVAWVTTKLKLMERAFVLQRRSYRETSLILEMVTGGAGRMGVLARGGRKRKGWDGLLQPFQPLLVAWTGRGELPLLIGCEADGRGYRLESEALFAGFYVNELLLRLSKRGAHGEGLLELYCRVLESLAEGKMEAALRPYEMALLEWLGMGLQLDREVVSGEAIRDEQIYCYGEEEGARLWNSASAGHKISGAALIALRREKFDNTQLCSEMRSLLRWVLRSHIGAAPLRSRELFRQYRKLK